MSNVPKLRFKEFSGEWSNKAINELSIVNPKSKELPNEFIYIDLESVEKGMLVKESSIFKAEAPSRAQRLLENDDILFQTVRPYQKNNYYFSLGNNYVASTGYAQLRAKESSYFLYQKLHTEKFVNAVMLRCTGTSYPAINSSDLATIKISVPSKQEQEKIASFLTSVDTKIEQLTRKEALLQQYKKGVMQKIFNQEIRFKADDGSEFCDWEEKKLGDLLNECKEKSTMNNQFDVLSSTKDSVVLQSEYFNREIASSDNTGYKILRVNQLVFSPQNLWLGNINVNTKYEVGIVSPSYKIYDFKNNFLVQYAKYFIKIPRMMYEYGQASEQGASVVRRSLNIELFNSILISLPSVEEQTKIANFLSSIDSKIEQVQKQLNSTKEFKKALLQQMFV